MNEYIEDGNDESSRTTWEDITRENLMANRPDLVEGLQALAADDWSHDEEAMEDDLRVKVAKANLARAAAVTELTEVLADRRTLAEGLARMAGIVMVRENELPDRIDPSLIELPPEPDAQDVADLRDGFLRNTPTPAAPPAWMHPAR